MNCSAPWDAGSWPVTVRPDYAAGLWAYALGRPAPEHPGYADAVLAAESGGWSSWWIRNWQDVVAVGEGCYFDEAEARRVVGFCTRFVCYPVEDGGGCVELLDWQVFDFFAPLFGWRRADGTRRFRRAVLWVPKKNGKSFLCSLLALYCLIKPDEPAPEVYVAAGDREQASIVYRESSALAKSSPAIAGRLRYIDSRRRIEAKRGRGLYRVLSSDAKLAEGIKWSALILDELHVQRPAMWQTVKGGGVSRKQPLMVAISTAGVYDEASIGWQQWDYSKRVLSGSVENSAYYTAIYGADEKDDWGLESTWRKANPSYGAALSASSLGELCREAENLPDEQPNFRRYHLNQWVQSKTAWLPPKKWEACKADYAEEDLYGRECYVACDLSQTQDITAMVAWFPGKPAHMLEWYWLPGETLVDAGQKNNAPYLSWHQGGWLRTTPGNYIDPAAIEYDCMSLLENYRVHKVVADPYNSTGLLQGLARAGYTVEHFPQTTRNFNEPMLRFSQHVYHKTMKHRGHPVTSWMLGNCQVVYDSGGLMKLTKSDGGGVTKRGAKRLKIDGIVAAVMACGVAELAEEKQPGLILV